MNNPDNAPVASKPSRAQPIPPPSEPRQYRAIGLVEGRYIPSEEQHTKGVVITTDGVEVDAVLLGRVISLIKNHLDLDQPHLWVVYPRTRQEEEQLHVQIAGVWEPENLDPAFTPEDEPVATADPADRESAESTLPIAPRPQLPLMEPAEPEPRCENGYFSVRGEVVFCAKETELVIVKIQQASRDPAEKRKKSFKLHLRGILPEDRPLRHFWDLHLMRQGQHLVIQEAYDMGFMPKPKPRKKFDQNRRGGPSKSYSARPTKPAKTTGGEASGSSRPTKPIIRKNKASS